MFPRPRYFWTIDAPAVHPQRMESFGGDLEHRLLALRVRCWWASPGPSFVAGGSGRLDGLEFFEAQEYRAIAAVRPPSLNCSETTAPRSCTPRATQRRQRQARLAKPRTRRNPVFASADAMQRYRWVPDPRWPQPQLSRLFRHARGHAVEDTASLTGRKFVAEKY